MSVLKYRIKNEDGILGDWESIRVIRGKDGKDGQNGGYYTPKVSFHGNNVLQFEFEPSVEDMPSVPPKTITIPAGKDGVGIKSVVLNSDYALTIRYTDGTYYTSESIRGEKGEQGATGPQGPKGDKGEQGIQGPKGDASVTATNIQNALGFTPANPSALSLGIHTDGLVYLFVSGQPVGSGIQLTAAGDVVGYVDENNNIVVSGNLADGTYSVKYEMDDGTTVDIGDLVVDNGVYYSVTNNLTQCANSNSTTQAIEGSSYSATITANSGYEIKSVTVTMGGTDVSSSAVSGGTIFIENVTGNIVISAVAEEAQAAEPVTVDIALTDGIRIGSDGTDRELAGFCATEMIDLRSIPKPCTIHLIKAKWHSDGGAMTSVRYYVADANGTRIDADATMVKTTDYFTVVANNDNFNDVTVTIISDVVGYARFSGNWANTDYADSSNNFADAHTKATLTYTPGS